MKKPRNIVFISDDQHRFDALEMMDVFPVRTPHLARMAREGIWYQHAYSPAPLCMPARCSLHNGLYAHQHGMVTNEGHWDFHLPTMQQALQKNGYYTAAIGKVHAFEAVPSHLDLTTVRDKIQELGYDFVHEVSGKALSRHCDCEWTHAMRKKDRLQSYRDAESLYTPLRAHPFVLEEEDYMDRYIGDRAVDFLDSYSYEKPLFLWAGLVSPHPPFDATEGMLEGHDPACQPPAKANPEPDSWADKRAHYCAMVEEVDRQVGRIIQVLEDKEQLDDTLLIFVSDHGEMLGDHGLEGKCHSYDPSTRVPLLMRYPPAIPAGQVRDAMVELTDLPATLLHAAGICEDVNDVLPRSPGRSLAPTWTDAEAVIRPFVYSEDGGQFYPPFQMIRTHDYKFTFYSGDNRVTLFNMVDDPDECCDLAESPDHTSIRETLIRQLFQHLAGTPAPHRI